MTIQTKQLQIIPATQRYDVVYTLDENSVKDGSHPASELRFPIIAWALCNVWDESDGETEESGDKWTIGLYFGDSGTPWLDEVGSVLQFPGAKYTFDRYEPQS